ncbi:LCP family protein [Romboutsia sp.]|uniref:LCP family protein n=1 Tax=Romboutsia sp. TaxID=1965302 RepID=UPI003F2E8C0F
MSNKTLKRIVITLATLVVLIPASVFGFVYFKLNTMYVPGGSVPGSNDYKVENGITNILLCGTDARPGETVSRTDSMMILTVDNKNKDIRVTSLARDAYVSTTSHGNIKLTEAYAYGGMDLLTETIESNFELDIQNYLLVDFNSFMDIIDTLGGITVEVKQNEINELNKFIPESYKFDTSKDKGEIQYIKSAGVQELNGYQALAYSRIRKGTSGGTEERDRRQRAVIEGVISGAKNLSVLEYPKMLDTILPYIKTNMKPTDMLGLGTQVLKMGTIDIKQMEFPINDGVHAKEDRINNKSVITFEQSSLDILHDFIFNNIVYEK